MKLCVMKSIWVCVAVVVCFILLASLSANLTAFAEDADIYDWASILNEPDAFFGSEKAISIADAIIQYQNADGGWKKDMAGNARGDWGKSTIDNDATTSQIRILARVYTQTGVEAYRLACMKGLDLLIDSQYDNGGWPQCFGAEDNYHAYITYNDNAMLHVLAIMQKLADQSGDFSFVDREYAAKGDQAMQKGLKCILDTQIVVNGEKTAWCQQYNDLTLEPAAGRAYEPAAICTRESVDLVCFLQQLDNPSSEILDSIRAAVGWMERSQLIGVRLVSENGDVEIVEDASADPLWARFYEIDTNRPIFADRDGTIHYDLTEISQERRLGYEWYGTWPDMLVRDASMLAQKDTAASPVANE